MKKDNLAFIIVVILTVLLFALFELSLAKAEVETLGTFKQNEVINLQQTCSNCTYCNLTKLQYPNSTILTIGRYMTKKGYDYNFSFINTSALGGYIATTCCDVEGVVTCVNYDFEVTFNGNEKPDGIVIVFFSIGFLIVVGFLAYLLIYNLGHFAQMDYDLGDLIKNVSAYFVLVGLYLLEIFYMGNEMIDNIMVWIIGITGFTNVGMSFLAFIICLLAKKKMDKENAW